MFIFYFVPWDPDYHVNFRNLNGFLKIFHGKIDAVFFGTMRT